MGRHFCSHYFFFFFSSRRRHTRFKCDWSSDVCSSDLLASCQNDTLRPNTTIAPILRWAGSKRKFLPKLIPFWTKGHNRYIEPFAGSACLFFALAPKAAVLGDSNKELMATYRVVRDEPERLYKRRCRLRRDSATYCRWRQNK